MGEYIRSMQDSPLEPRSMMPKTGRCNSIRMWKTRLYRGVVAEGDDGLLNEVNLAWSEFGSARLVGVVHVVVYGENMFTQWS